MLSLDSDVNLCQNSFESSILEFPSEVAWLCCGRKSQASLGWEGAGCTLELDSIGCKYHLEMLSKVV